MVGVHVTDQSTNLNLVIPMDAELTAIGAIGVYTDHVITNVEAVFKNDSDIVTIPPPPMVVEDVQVMLRWFVHVTHKHVQVGRHGDHGELAHFHAMEVYDSVSATVLKDIALDHSLRSVSVIFIGVPENSFN